MEFTLVQRGKNKKEQTIFELRPLFGHDSSEKWSQQKFNKIYILLQATSSVP